jgi:hypothetical protein
MEETSLTFHLLHVESRPVLADVYHRLAGCKLEIKSAPALANDGWKWSGRWESNPSGTDPLCLVGQYSTVGMHGCV